MLGQNSRLSGPPILAKKLSLNEWISADDSSRGNTAYFLELVEVPSPRAREKWKFKAPEKMRAAVSKRLRSLGHSEATRRRYSASSRSYGKAGTPLEGT